MKIIALLEEFVEIELGLANGKEYYSQGILFRNKTDIGVVILMIKEIGEGLKIITIKSPLYSREFEFSISKDFVILKNDYLMFIPIEELECNGELKHRTKVYSKDELKTLRYLWEFIFITLIMMEKIAFVIQRDYTSIFWKIQRNLKNKSN